MSPRCPVCPKADTTGRFYEYTPELDAARRSRALTLASSTARPARPCIVAAGDDAEVGARLPERLRIDVRTNGCLFYVGRALGALGERVLQKTLRALAALGRLRDRGRGRGFTTGGPALRFRDLVTC